MSVCLTPNGMHIERGWGNKEIVSTLSDGQIELIVRGGLEYDIVKSELITLSGEALKDGVVTQDEAEIICHWLKNNVKEEKNIVSRVLFARIKEMLADGHLDEEEQKDLIYLLGTLHGETKEMSQEGYSTSLPFCKPPPEVVFPDKGFCFTGQFAYGPRKKCAEVVDGLGGKIEKRINWRVDYLVVGTLCTRDWAHSTHGRKIEEALALKSRGEKDIHIITEDHWARTAFNMH